MRVCVSAEERFLRTPDGRIWSGVGSTSGYSFWKRYLDVFDHVTVIARVADCTAPDSRCAQADGDSVTFHPVPYYVGPVQYGLRYFSIRRSIRRGIRGSEAIIMRVSSALASILERRLPRSRPFGLEVLGDVYESFAAGALDHPLRTFFRWRFTAELKRQCRKACAVAYVSRESLQPRYPAREQAFTTSYSSIDLGDDAFAASARIFDRTPPVLRLISVGTLEVMYKGFDTLIDAVAQCVKARVNLRLVIVGDGRRRAELEEQARAFGLANTIVFAGRLFGADAVRRALDQADVFILASKTEGLPRAMIEAMARGLPCIGSAVGGIPELLNRNELFERGSAAELGEKIAALARDPERMTRLSAANRIKAREYHADVIRERRRRFYHQVKLATSEWQQMIRCGTKGHGISMGQTDNPRS